MANIKSALKRIKSSERNRLRNRSYKSAVKTLTKTYFAALSEYSSNPSPASLEQVNTTLSAAFSKIDKAVKCGVLHANTGARQKARLSRALKQQEAAAS